MVDIVKAIVFKIKQL